MNLDHARQYFARVIPWPQDGEQPSYVNVHWTMKRPDRDKPFWMGRATRSVDEAAKTVKWAMSLPDTRDVYACLSSQRVAETKTSAKGKTYLNAVRSQDNAVALNSLFLDVDIKDTAYPDATSAVTALKEFIKATGLPRQTMTVASGGGLHVYWTLMRALPPEEWKPLANALATAAKKHGLKCDTVCTVDSARLLRVPDTLNHKLEKPRPVRIAGTVVEHNYSVERIEQALKPYMTEPVASALPRRAPLVGVNDLAAGIETKAQPIDLDNVAAQCAFIKDAIDTAGAGFANPLWNLTTLISVFSTGLEQDAHRMAAGHPDYTVESTQELFERKQREKEAKGLGWPSCKSISFAGCTACDACPHKDAGKSPLNFGMRNLPVPTQPVSDLPRGYVRDAAGIVCMTTVDEDGNPVMLPVIDYPITDAWLQNHPWTLNFTTATHTGATAHIALPTTACSTKDGIPRELSRQGLLMHERQHKIAKEFFVSFIKTLQGRRDAVISSAPYGWNMRAGKIEGFVYAGQVWTPAGSRPAGATDPALARQYQPTGDLQPWLDAAEMVTSQSRPELDAILAASFGAPLVQLTGMDGMMLSAYSQESGIGKTTASRIAQAVWGHPVQGMQGLSDTQNSVVGKMSLLRSLPIFWDELKSDEDAKKFVNLTFQLTGGKGKARMNADSSLKDIGEWNTMMVICSNDSMVDYMTSHTKMSTAGLFRIFEYKVTPGVKGQIDPALAQRISAKLRANFGVVGLEYAKYLGANFEAIDKEVCDLEQEIGKQANTMQDERFWRSTITCVCMGARIANRLGYTKIDEKALREFMLKTLESMREQRRDTHVDMDKSINASTILAQFININRTHHTLVTNRLHVGAGRPAAGDIVIKSDLSKVNGIYIHIGLEDKLMRISSYHLQEWLTSKGYQRKQLMDAMAKHYGLTKVIGRLASGTDLRCPKEYLLQIDLSLADDLNFIDEV